MVVGDPGYWADHFRSIDERLIARIAALWPQCLSVLSKNPQEDEITLNLKSRLIKDSEARCIFHYLEYQFEPVGFTPEGLAFSKGRIDLAVLLDQDCTRYLAYECKRLNVHYNGVRQSLATPYVNDGVRRFVTEQYAEGLPVGCMLGYVLDGDMSFAQERVHAAINANKYAIALTNGPEGASPIASIERFTTNHTRSASGELIHVRHSLLPFPVKTASVTAASYVKNLLQFFSALRFRFRFGSAALPAPSGRQGRGWPPVRPPFAFPLLPAARRAQLALAPSLRPRSLAFPKCPRLL